MSLDLISLLYPASHLSNTKRVTCLTFVNGWSSILSCFDLVRAAPKVLVWRVVACDKI